MDESRDSITETKENILAHLDNKTRQEVLYNELLDAEGKFVDNLRKLKNFDDECDCDEPKQANTISMGDTHSGEEYVVVKRCMACGGYIEEKEWE